MTKEDLKNKQINIKNEDTDKLGLSYLFSNRLRRTPLKIGSMISNEIKTYTIDRINSKNWWSILYEAQDASGKNYFVQEIFPESKDGDQYFRDDQETICVGNNQSQRRLDWLIKCAKYKDQIKNQKIIPVVEIIFNWNNCYRIFEKGQATTLRQLLESNKIIMNSENRLIQAVEISLKINSVMKTLHELDILYLGLDPTQVIVEFKWGEIENYEVKLLESLFSAKLITERCDERTFLFQKSPYISPNYSTIDTSNDFYSVVSIFYEILKRRKITRDMQRYSYLQNESINELCSNYGKSAQKLIDFFENGLEGVLIHCDTLEKELLNLKNVE